MITIKVNGIDVNIDPFVMKRIKKFAQLNGVPVEDAVGLLLESVS